MTTSGEAAGDSPAAPGSLHVDVTALPGETKRYAFAAAPQPGGRHDWRAHGEVEQIGDQLEITQLQIQPGPDASGGVTSAMIREVRLGALLDSVRAAVSTAIAPSIAVAAGDISKRGGRQALSDELLREVAVLYLTETAPGRPSGAVGRMAERYGRPVETIRTWLSRARSAGWLGSSIKGRSGAQPGPRLSEVSLEELEQIHPGLIEHVVVRPDGTVEDVTRR